MNHNFLSFEITVLLPKVNLYGYTKVWSKYNPSTSEVVLETNKIILIDTCHSIPQYEVRSGWTIIDALTWLEAQGYIVEVSSISKGTSWSYFIYDRNDSEILQDKPNKSNSRIEAYTAGILHCLNLIKDEKSNRTT